jgi:hypothetical protein
MIMIDDQIGVSSGLITFIKDTCNAENLDGYTITIWALNEAECHVDLRLIYIPDLIGNEFIIKVCFLHELAHAIRGNTTPPWHDSEYHVILDNLIARHLGKTHQWIAEWAHAGFG